MSTTMTPEELTTWHDGLPPYVRELLAHIVDEGGLNGRTVEQAMSEAHTARQARHEFLLRAEHPHARIFRAMLAARVKANAEAAEAHRRGVRDTLEFAAREVFRPEYEVDLPDFP
jgi:hypothetical protein